MGDFSRLDLRLRRKFYLARKNLVGLSQLLYLSVSGAYKSTSRVSVCTTVKDRFEHLEQTFLRNIADNSSYPNCDFILLNYNCPDPRTEEWARTVLKPYIEEGKVIYYYLPDVPKYDFAHAQNLAFRLAQGDIVCNIGADNFIGKNFVAYVAAVLGRERSFLRGPVDGRGLGGKICVKRDDWDRVGGYDERLTDWGGDDTDFASRLRTIGLKHRVVLPERYCQIISHSDELRMRHLSEGDKDESAKRARAIQRENAELGVIRPNGSKFGHGRVQKNFSEWIEV